tara:strand:- start:218 stop:412 length:195 start_codon:yes stop_codon:yes gene_type:complete
MEMHFEILAKDFLDNEKLMEDFLTHNKFEFLATHHEFVSEQDWEITYIKLMNMVRNKVLKAKYL